jgi:Domain of unknown function (DUF4148)
MKTLTFKTLAAASGLVALASLSVLPVYADSPKDLTIGTASFANFESTKSRDQVREEYFQAMKEGGLARASGTEVDADSPALAKAPTSNLQRQDVYAETLEWMRATHSAEIGMGE